MVERLAGAEATVYHQMLGTIRQKKRRNQLRENLFLAKKRLDQIGFSVPDSMRDFDAVIGWPEKAVMVPARRIRPGQFSSSDAPGLAADLNDRFNTSYFRQIERMAIESSLQHGVAFTFATPGDTLNGDPEVVLSARSALEATANIDRRTLQVTEALELVDRKTSLMYLPGETLLIKLDGSELTVSKRIRGSASGISCIPYIWGRSLNRPFGRSRITRPVMDLSGQAIRIMLRQEVQAEHFSSPQRVLEGARQAAFNDSKGRARDPWDIATGSIWGIPDFFDEDTGEWRRANLKQLAASSMQPHTDHLRSIAMMYSGETGIPVDQLGIVQDNPSSADAIRANESQLNSLVRAELPNYADDRRMLGYHVMQAGEGWSPGLERDIRRVQAVMHSPETSTQQSAAYWAAEFIKSNPWAAESDVVLEMWGFDDSQLERLRDERRRLKGSGLVDRLLANRNQGPSQVATARPAASQE